MSNSETPPTPRPEALKKLAQLRIERLKKEEEEEQWISGEELYTEGSSDEDDMALRTKRKSNERGLKKSRSAGSKPKKQIKEENKKPQSHLIPPQLNLTSCLEKNEIEDKTAPLHSGKDEKSVDKLCTELNPKGLAGDTLACSSSTQDDEIQPEISWRPKRGSIKLPNLTTEGRVELLGLENKSVIPFIDADQAYSAMIETVKKLKKFFVDESSIFSRITDEIGSLRQKNIRGINVNRTLCKLLTSDWHFLHERCDVKSALTNMNILDLLLEIIDFKQKEAHEETLDVELQIRDELSQFMASHAPSNDEVTNNICSFLQHCLLAEDKDNLKGIRSLNIEDDMQDRMYYANENYQYLETKDCKNVVCTDAVELTIFNKSLNSGNKMCTFSVSPDEKHDDSETIEDSEENVPLTDEERLRLDLLLDDDDNEFQSIKCHINDNNSNSYCTAVHFKGEKKYENYAFNEEMKQSLEKINEKLQAFSKNQSENKISFQKNSQNSCDPLEPDSQES